MANMPDAAMPFMTLSRSLLSWLTILNALGGAAAATAPDADEEEDEGSGGRGAAVVLNQFLEVAAATAMWLRLASRPKRAQSGSATCARWPAVLPLYRARARQCADEAAVYVRRSARTPAHRELCM